MAAALHSLQMDCMYNNQVLMRQIHKTYDHRIRLLLQQKEVIIQSIQQSMDQQMGRLVDAVMAMELKTTTNQTSTGSGSEVRFFLVVCSVSLSVNEYSLWFGPG